MSASLLADCGGEAPPPAEAVTTASARPIATSNVVPTASGIPAVVASASAAPIGQPPAPDPCRGTSLDLDTLFHTDMGCPVSADPVAFPTASLAMTTDVKRLTVKHDSWGKIPVTFTNTTDAPLDIQIDASCGVPRFLAGVSPPTPRALPSGSGIGVGGKNCIAILCHPHSVHVVLAPHGTAMRTVGFYPGEVPPAYCPGEPPTPYPAGNGYTVEFRSPFKVEGEAPVIQIPLTVTP
jgi:hypothetical protein